ncbi:Uncharacterised protein [Candidatus Bilamarchaeum dharawalense]|uniref:Uncharacterized protein n=1 Tax=Candidatus Bilamarchaeum dharawalense TaxID=2885759 RepID=A0A5E4LN15_9ARCH|nr:Uncharacterised protein [Candidatus Bilamarchaeum dharawalense]
MNSRARFASRVIAVNTSGVAFLGEQPAGPDPRKLDPINDRREIVLKHAQSSRFFAQSEVDARMLGGYSAYHQWYTRGKKGPDPFFTIDVDTVVAALKALTPIEVRELRSELYSMSFGTYCCPREFAAAASEARRRLQEIGG